MSYVEKAFWDYLKSTIFGGIRILLSRRLILFSMILFVSSILTTVVILLQGQASEILTEEVLTFIFSLQVSIAVGFLVAGLVSKRLNTLFKFLVLLAVVVVVQILSVLAETNGSLQPISDLITQYVPLFTFFSWSFLIPLASFAFAKGLFSNKITGSVLFLGKPSRERQSIFSGLMALIAILSLIWNITIAYIGLTEPRMSYLIVGIVGIVIATLIFLTVRGFLTGDDVFNTILGFFFIVSLPNQIMIFLTSVSGSVNIITSFDYIMVLFSLIYSAQNISRRIKMRGVVIDPQKKEKIKEDPFRIGRFIGFIGGEGVVLVYLGLALGFQLVQLQVLSGTATAWIGIFGNALSFSEVAHDVQMISMGLILVISLAVYKLQRGKDYWEADIYRFDFLPPYDDLVDYMERIKSGEISKTDIAMTMGKKAVEASGIGVLSAARRFSSIFRRKGD